MPVGSSRLSVSLGLGATFHANKERTFREAQLTGERGRASWDRRNMM